MFPHKRVYWTWANVPDHLETKTQIKKRKAWKEGVEFAAIKGNVLNSDGYIKLYYSADFQHELCRFKKFYLDDKTQEEGIDVFLVRYFLMEAPSAQNSMTDQVAKIYVNTTKEKEMYFRSYAMTVTQLEEAAEYLKYLNDNCKDKLIRIVRKRQRAYLKTKKKK